MIGRRSMICCPVTTVRWWGACAAVCMLFQALVAPRAATGQTAPAGAANEPTPRELLVPYADLPFLLSGETRRVFMTRDEFRALKIAARRAPDEPLPQETAWLSADYQVAVESGRASIKASLQLEVLADGLHAVPLLIGGVGIRDARLDDQPAALSSSDGPLQLAVSGRGVHRLELDMVLPVEVAAAQQSLSWQLPVPSTARMHVTVPGNVELKSGAAVIQRRVDQAAGLTHFSIVPTNETMKLVMSLNNRLLRDETAVLARGVLISEITQGYQRLHASLSMNILHGGTDEFRIAIPEDFEVTQVTTPLLSRWSVQASPAPEGGKLLLIKLREVATDRVVLNLRADRASNELTDWQMPQLQPIGVDGMSSVVGVVAEAQLGFQPLEAEELIAIDSQVITAALPSSVLASEPGAPPVRVVAGYYAPGNDYRLATRFVRQEPGLDVTTSLLLTLGDRGLELDGGFALSPTSEKIFAFDFAVPSEWSVDAVRTGEGTPLTFQRFAVDGGWRVRVQLPSGLAPRTTMNIQFHAAWTPAGWMDNWEQQSLVLPKVAASPNSNVRETGAIAVRAVDDLKIQPQSTSNLIVISDKEKSKYGCGDVPTNFAWRYLNTDWQGSLVVTRAQPRIVGRVQSFLQLSPDALTAHFELLYDVEGARTQRVSFSLPASSPEEIAIRGLGDTTVKETSSQLSDGRRLWIVQLAERKAGRVGLAVDYVQPVTEQVIASLTLPDARAESVDYQTGLVAVEGHAELDVTVGQHPRSVDLGELVDAQYQVGKRLLGVYSYTGQPSPVVVQAARRDILGLPSTIAQRAELVTLVGAGGVSQTAARFALRTKAQYIEIRLPETATLWSVMVDSRPAVPERQGDRIVVALRTEAAQQMRDLQIVYEQPVKSLAVRETVQLGAPTLWQRAEGDADSQEIPVADLRWETFLPAGFRLVRAEGTVSLEQEEHGQWYGISNWLEWLVELGGGRRNILPTAVRKNTSENFLGGLLSWTEIPPASRGLSNRMAGMDGVAADAVTYSAEELAMPAAPQSAAASAVPPPAAQPMPPGAADPSQAVPLAGTALGRQPSAAWALEGLRCLNIDLTPASFGQSVVFNSLGADPKVVLTLANGQRWRWLGGLFGLALVAWGLARTRMQAMAQLRLAAAAVFLALLLPIVIGWAVELEPLVESVTAAALVLVALAIVIELARRLSARFQKLREERWRNSATRQVARGSAPSVTNASGAAGKTTLIWMLCAVGGLGTFEAANAQDGRSAAASLQVLELDDLAALINALPSGGPVRIPADAIVVPYDPEALDEAKGQPGSDRILVPYDLYERLRNAAHIDPNVTTRAPVLPWAWTGAEFHTTLGSSDVLLVTGKLSVELFDEKSISLPMHFSGGVLQKITVDGQPARIQVVEAKPDSMPAAATPGQGLPAAPAVANDRLMLLHLSGKGKKQIDVEVRMQVERRGGWRVVQGRLPAAPASRLILRVAQPQSEVRLNGMYDRVTHDIRSADEAIETALPAGGVASWQWRTKIAEAAIDQGLSVESRAVFDIQEDGLRLAWQGHFEFRRGRRESFSLSVPGDYLVEKVVGNNIRGWSVQKDGDRQQLTIDLLASVAERESLLVLLYSNRSLAELDSQPSASQAVQVPVVRVPDAMLQKGQLTVRRSRLLELRVAKSEGVSRIDTPDNSTWLTEQPDASPVALLPFQAFQFSQVPFDYALTARPARSQVRVTTQTLLSLSQLESSLESKLTLQVQDRQLYHLRLLVPANWKLQEPTVAVPYEWTRSTSDNQQTVDLYFASGISGTLPIVLRGRLEQSLVPADDGSIAPVPVPKITVSNVLQHKGDIVVISDPAYDVTAGSLQNCGLGLLGSASGWLSEQYRPLGRLLLHYESDDIAGQLQVTQRTPQVTAFSVTNIKLSDRAIEETLYFEFTIRAAGTNRLSIVVPGRLANARVRGPLIRSQTWTPLGAEADSPARLVVQLQEDVMGQYSLILEHDRVLSSGPQSAPIPTIETGKTDHRFVTLENSGRDELIVEKSQELERLQRSQSQWQLLSGLLGGKTTEAYVVAQQAATPELLFNTKDRAVVETVGARIGIAQTVMTVDETGAYRASMELRIENRTEQYLEIELPPGARLWTVHLAGEPVKPMTSSSSTAGQVGPAAQSSTAADSTASTGNSTTVSTTAQARGGQRVRIPLVKTAVGDLDYAVVIKYGGQLAKPGALARTSFPLVQTININVELSQVRLRLPPGLQWWNFGGSMSRVEQEGDFTAGWLSFRTRQLAELTQVMSKTSAMDFSRARATNNLRALGKEIELFRDLASRQSGEQLQQQLSYNGAAWFDAQKELAKPVEELTEGLGLPTNRAVLNARVQAQGNAPSLNVASASDANFQVPAIVQNTPDSVLAANEFDAEWLSKNALQDATPQKGKAKDERSEARDSVRRLGRVLEKGQVPTPELERMKQAQAGKPAAPTIKAEDYGMLPPTDAKTDDRAAQVFRYQQMLEQSGQATSGDMTMRGRQFDADALGASAMGGSMGGRGFEARGSAMPQPPGSPALSTPSEGRPVVGDFAVGQVADLPAAAAQFGNAPTAAGLAAQGPQVNLNQANGQLASPLLSVATPAGYLASLDADLPVRGQEFLFTTPRGAAQITAQSVSKRTVYRWGVIAFLLVVGGVAWLAGGWILAIGLGWRKVASIVMLVGSLAWMLGGIAPLFGVLGLLAALVVWPSRREAVLPAAAIGQV